MRARIIYWFVDIDVCISTKHTLFGFNATCLYLQSKTKGDLVDFFKEVTWSKKKGKFVTPMTEETYVSVLDMFGKKCSHLILFFYHKRMIFLP